MGVLNVRSAKLARATKVNKKPDSTASGKGRKDEAEDAMAKKKKAKAEQEAQEAARLEAEKQRKSELAKERIERYLNPNKPRIRVQVSKAVGTVLVSRMQQYGKTHYYPENQIAEVFAELLQQTSFSPRDVEHFKALGYKVMLTSRRIEEEEL